MSHSLTLVTAYAIICALWWTLSLVVPLWRRPERPAILRPWMEVGFALAAMLAIVLLGQLWSHGVRLHGSGGWKPLAEAFNQLLIFSPILLLPLLRKQGFASAWIQRSQMWTRLAIGVVFAILALLVYSLSEKGALPFIDAIKAVFLFKNAHVAVQVLLEDIAIAVLFVRLAAALHPRWAVLLVAALFAAGHLPAMFARGAPTAEMFSLVRDFGLGALVIGTLWRGADILWFWPVHFVLDMTQFVKHAG